MTLQIRKHYHKYPVDLNTIPKQTKLWGAKTFEGLMERVTELPVTIQTSYDWAAYMNQSQAPKYVTKLSSWSGLWFCRESKERISLGKKQCLRTALMALFAQIKWIVWGPRHNQDTSVLPPPLLCVRYGSPGLGCLSWTPVPQTVIVFWANKSLYTAGLPTWYLPQTLLKWSKKRGKTEIKPCLG